MRCDEFSPREFGESAMLESELSSPTYTAQN